MLAMVTLGGNNAEARTKRHHGWHNAGVSSHGSIRVHHRKRHRLYRGARVKPQPVVEPCFLFCSTAPFTRRKKIDAPVSTGYGVSHARTSFVRGRLVCAINVGRELRARGYNPPNTARARDFLHYGSSSSGKPGDIAVFSRGRRGGHVAIVAGYGPNGERLYLNPSSRRQAWQVGAYHRTPIAFRSPG